MQQSAVRVVVFMIVVSGSSIAGGAVPGEDTGEGLAGDARSVRADSSQTEELVSTLEDFMTSLHDRLIPFLFH